MGVPKGPFAHPPEKKTPKGKTKRPWSNATEEGRWRKSRNVSRGFEGHPRLKKVLKTGQASYKKQKEGMGKRG